MAEAIELPASLFKRTPGQRAAYARFFMNASGLFWPESFSLIRAGNLQLTCFRRRALGLRYPLMCVLAEQDPAFGPLDPATVPRSVLADVPHAEELGILKIFLAGECASLVAPPGYLAAFAREEDPEVLELAPDYESFLATLGKHTRRQMRQLRRKAARAGVRFVFGSVQPFGFGERLELGKRARPERFSAAQVIRYERFLSAQPRNYAAGLYSATGELLSYSSGLISESSAILRYQMNDRRYPKASLSLTMRAYLLEALIENGFSELIIPGGVAGVLQHFCRHRAGGELVLIRRNFSARCLAWAARIWSPSSSVAAASRIARRFKSPAI